MRDHLDQASGERMSLDDYWPDFERHFWQTDPSGFWKLERQQFFREPGNQSWKAFANGDWAESLRLLEAGHADMSAYFARVARHGFQVRRVRVVEWPLTPYLQWELHALRQREQCGADIRILGADRVRELEQGGVLPEIYTLGTSVMYEAVYGGDGVLAHAIKFIDESLIVQCQRIISELYGAGEPLADYFEREVAPLPAPTVERSQ